MNPPHSRPAYRVERLGAYGWEDVASAWGMLQACRILSSRRGRGETVRIWDVQRKCADVTVRPGEDWEYELWK